MTHQRHHLTAAEAERRHPGFYDAAARLMAAPPRRTAVPCPPPPAVRPAPAGGHDYGRIVLWVVCLLAGPPVLAGVITGLALAAEFILPVCAAVMIVLVVIRPHRRKLWKKKRKN